MKTVIVKNTVIGEGQPKIIIPLMETDDRTLIAELQEIKKGKPDLIEWRADQYKHVEDINAVRNMLGNLAAETGNIPLIFTFRTVNEGGNKPVSHDYYIQLIKEAIRSPGVDLIDIELFTAGTELKGLIRQAEENGKYIICSNHDFRQTPEKKEIIHRLRKMQKYGAHILKIAVMPENVRDVLTLLDATCTMQEKYAERPLITMAMGKAGLISRLSGEVFGSSCTFGSGKHTSAPGQIPASELKDVLEIIHKHSGK